MSFPPHRPLMWAPRPLPLTVAATQSLTVQWGRTPRCAAPSYLFLVTFFGWLCILYHSWLKKNVAVNELLLFKNIFIYVWLLKSTFLSLPPWQPNVGMLDRSRMALCAFTLLFLSLNPLASLLCSSSSSSAGANGDIGARYSGRNVLGVDIPGTDKVRRWNPQ